MQILRSRIVQVVSMLALALVAAFALPAQAFAADGVKYLDTQGHEQIQDNVAEVASSDTSWGANDDAEHWYVVQGNVTINQRVFVMGKMHLILADGAMLTIHGGINVDRGDSLSIYGQEQGTGELIANAETRSSSPGIGSYNSGSAGAITIAGGTVTAKGGQWAAGIGGGYGGMGGTVTITGGTVDAEGGYWASGIGGGERGPGAWLPLRGALLPRRVVPRAPASAADEAPGVVTFLSLVAPSPLRAVMREPVSAVVMAKRAARSPSAVALLSRMVVSMAVPASAVVMAARVVMSLFEASVVCVTRG